MESKKKETPAIPVQYKIKGFHIPP